MLPNKFNANIDWPTSNFVEANKIQGYATYKMLEHIIDYGMCGVNNQPQAKDFDPKLPQEINMRFNYIGPDIPEWDIDVCIDPNVELNKQKCLIRHTEIDVESELFTISHHFCKLFQLLQVFEKNTNKKRIKALKMTECFEVEEFCYSDDENKN